MQLGTAAPTRAAWRQREWLDGALPHVPAPSLKRMGVDVLDSADEPATLMQCLAAVCDVPAPPLSPALVSNSRSNRCADTPAPPL